MCHAKAAEHNAAEGEREKGESELRFGVAEPCTVECVGQRLIGEACMRMEDAHRREHSAWVGG